MKRRTIAEIEEMMSDILKDLRGDESDLYWALYDIKDIAERSFEDIDEDAWDSVRDAVLDIFRDMEEERGK